MVLFQLPPNFKKDLQLLNDFLASLPKEMKCAFEFRHESWFGDELSAALRAKNAALCVADEKVEAPTVATADHSYFRLRDLGYTKADLARWAKIIALHNQSAKDVYVYFKHEESGVGPKFAQQLMKLLGPKATSAEAS